MTTMIKSAVMALFLYLTAAMTAAAVDFPAGQARIVTTSGQSHVFAIEVAATPEARQQGLMHRTDLGPNQGMFFDFGQTRFVTMWMKDTPLPLDMLFISEDGVITHIAENTTPFSLDVVGSRQDVRYVLEINGGRSKALGITTGAKISVVSGTTILK